MYITTNRPNGPLHVGVTSNLARRVWEHREGVAERFTAKHGLKRLVYREEHATMPLAIQRERDIKHWPRAWKIQLILEGNPGWADLFATLQ